MVRAWLSLSQQQGLTQGTLESSLVQLPTPRARSRLSSPRPAWEVWAQHARDLPSREEF